jgi:hypothetical protein
MPTAEPNWHGTLTPDTVEDVLLAEGYAEYQIINVDGAQRVDYTTDGSAPAIGGTPTGRVLAMIAGYDDVINVNSQASPAQTVKLKSAGAAHVSIQTIAGPSEG